MSSLTALKVSELAVSTLTVLLLFSANAIIYVFVKLLVPSRAGEQSVVNEKKIPPFEWTRSSVLALTSELVVFGGLLVYIWGCENIPLFDHGNKEHTPDFFWFICLMVLLFALGSMEHHPQVNDVINRDQTEEWKGWMQTVFLLYHYFHEEEVYNSVRVMISCYVWMTGFGNFSFFYIKSDYSFSRFLQMMWRLNFTVVFLCMLMNNMYMLYYICPLHTFYFLVVFGTMRAFKEVNHTHWGIRVKLAAVGLIIYIVFLWLSNSPHPGAAVGAYGIKYEWHFRSGLDHYSTFFGMIFALNFPQTTAWLSKVEALPRSKHVLVKVSVGLVLLGLSTWWAVNILPLPKLEFNSMNPYTFMIPLLTYIYFRNSTKYLRQVHLSVLSTIGKYTLETYLMQHHIWLTSNAKTILVLVPGYPKINLVVVTAIYFTVARRIYRTTMATRAMLVPDDATTAATYLGWLMGIMGVAGIFAAILQYLDPSWILFCVIALAVGCATFFIVKRKLEANAAISASLDRPSQRQWRDSLIVVGCGLFVGTLGIVLIPSLQLTGAQMNEGPIRPKATLSLCTKAVGMGKWVSTGSATCGSESSAYCQAESWAWTDANAQRACKFEAVKPSAAFKLVEGREVAFVGDIATYDLFVATHKLIDPAAGHKVVASLEEDFREARRVHDAQLPQASESGALFFHSAPTMSAAADVTASSYLSSASVVVVGSWIEDSVGNVDPSSYLDAAAQVAANLKGTSCILLLPGSIFEKKLEQDSFVRSETAATLSEVLQGEVADQLLNCHMLDVAAFSAGRTHDSVDGLRVGTVTNMAIANILLNEVKVIAPPPVLEKKTTGKGKGSGGGVAQNPTYGAAALAVAFLMLFTMDNYGGLSFIMLRLLSPFTAPVTWLESTTELHRKIGVTSYSKVDMETASEFGESVEGECLTEESQSALEGDQVA
eukprot:CAMPEP_0184536834 /NCGR_PEP_ID=MMETSP0198_2-20121128/16674_1 /TAXON_ID=1112570 /ORGANISM="Thraustochytrium sp., Strain LLF1b" /LENGTH=937 /DNA_ID=CAMNT_0026930049 /DNA_START=75 /DNA_END=2888 /DNA_ORIENTATION=+